MEPNTHVAYIPTWLGMQNMHEKGGWRKWLRPTWDFQEGSVLIVDEAQTSYWNTNFWLQIKAIKLESRYRVITFASYGSAGRNNFDAIPHHITPVQDVSLWPADHGDGIAVGLLLTKSELSDLAAKQVVGHRFDASFLNCMFDLTNGHVGACEDLMRIVVAHSARYVHAEIIN
jgi:hypothetical protein